MPMQTRRVSKDLTSYLRLAIVAAQQAGRLLARYAGKPSTVRTKRSVVDLVTEIDRRAERLIRRILGQATPTFGFLGEEYGQRAQRSRYQWVVDPLDGTMNFVHGVPFFGVSIALACEQTPVIGVIYDPSRSELFTAIGGHGAWLNGKRIRVSATRRLSLSLLATGFSSRFRTRPQPYLEWFQTLERGSHSVRRLGSTALCLAYVAAGRLEGFYERDLWPWDIAAGMVLVEEAGGQVSDFRGRTVALAQGRLVASNGRIHRPLLQRLVRGRPPP